MREETKNKLLASGIVGTLAWLALGPEGRRKAGDLLAQFVVAVAEAEERKSIEQSSMEAQPSQQTMTSPGVQSLAGLISVPSATSLSHSLAAPDLEPDARWRTIIVHPSVVLVLGKRGSGKSALGYRLLELFRHVAKPHVVGVPSAAGSLLPDWIGIAPDLETVPPKSIVLVDEAYLHYHARGSMARESMAMSQAVNLSRQKEQTFIFVSQEARQVDRNISSSACVVVFKDLGMLQLEFDRREFNKLAEQARRAFAALMGDKRRHGFVYAPDSDFLGMMQSAVPSFWKPSLSRLFAAKATPAAPRTPNRMTPQEKAEKAKEMRASGASYKEIAEALGVVRGTVVNYVKGYPYRRKGETDLGMPPFPPV